MVRGDLIRYARCEQRLTMRRVQEQGGPSPGLQSAVERGLRHDVSADTLSRWAKALNITCDFARGVTPSLRDGVAPIGLAREISGLLRHRPPLDHSIQERARHVLYLTSRSQHLPEVVLSYVLDLRLNDLRQMISGVKPVPEPILCALSALIGNDRLFADSKSMEESLLDQILQDALKMPLHHGLKRSQGPRSGYLAPIK